MGADRGRDDAVLRRSLRALIGLRLLVVSAILGLGIVFLRGEAGVERWNRPFFAMLGITVLLSAAYWAGVKRGKAFRFQAVLQLLVDIGLATGIIHYTGDSASPFALLYVLIISAGSRFLLLRGTILIAMLCAVVHAAHLSLHAAFGGERAVGLIGLLAPAAYTEGGSRLLALQLGLYTITFFFLAVVSGYLSVRVHRGGEALAAARTRLRRASLNTDQILRSLSSGLLTVDRDGRIGHFNRAAERITGLESENVFARPFEEVLEKASPPLVTLLRGILSGWDGVLRQETTLVSASGEVVPIGVSATPLRDEKGGVAGVVAIFQDLTDVRKMEEHVRHVDRLAAIGELSAGIAHEIRNPLATISGSIQVLQGDLPVEGENCRLLELIVRESDRLHRIVEDFLSFARTGPTEQRPVDLVGLLEEIRDLVANHPKRNPGVEVRFENAEERCMVRGDGEQLRRVFLNLVVNAFEAMGEKGTLTVRVRPVLAFQASPEDYPVSAVAVSVSDTGPGIGPRERAELFRPFFTTKKGGVGLGLALAQKIVVSHRGKIDVFGENGGTTFTVLLPREESRPRHMETRHIESACSASAKGGRSRKASEVSPS
ncbi:MAG: ATP-binding protein [Candidatus Eisenbacteria bacterium]